MEDTRLASNMLWVEYLTRRELLKAYFLEADWMHAADHPRKLCPRLQRMKKKKKKMSRQMKVSEMKATVGVLLQLKATQQIAHYDLEENLANVGSTVRAAGGGSVSHLHGERRRIVVPMASRGHGNGSKMQRAFTAWTASNALEMIPQISGASEASCSIGFDLPSRKWQASRRRSSWTTRLTGQQASDSGLAAASAAAQRICCGNRAHGLGEAYSAYTCVVRRSLDKACIALHRQLKMEAGRTGLLICELLRIIAQGTVYGSL